MLIGAGFYRGFLGEFHHKSSVATSAVFMMQVVASSSFTARNGSYSSIHLHHMPLKVSSWDQSIRIGCAYKKFLASKRQLHRAEQKLVQIQMLSSNSIVCGMQERQASEWERDEARWLREEKRWLREEERWLREEARWAAERKDLLEQTSVFKEEMKDLKFKIARLESQVKDENVKDGALSDLIVSLTSLLQSLNMATSLGSESQGSSFEAQISSSASIPTDIRAALGDISLEIPTKNIEMITPVSQPSILELKGVPSTPSRSYEKHNRTLKRGAEGDDVKAMQKALAKLGFYSGGDDMEYSIFSSGTERAVRSWQATIGASEDGIVTTELLLKLLGEETPVAAEKPASSSPSQVKVVPAAKPTASTSTSGAKSPASVVKTNASATAGTEKPTGSKADSFSPKKPKNTGVEASQRRVYLLGENRWEEPDRLLSKNGPTTAAAVTVVLSEKCFSCKGQGDMLCTECEGTGELNVEEQFLEWADEGAKCPYCEGKGALDCDVCDGKGVRA